MIEVGLVSKAVADAVSPITRDPCYVKNIAKMKPEPHPEHKNHFRLFELTQSDWEFLATLGMPLNVAIEQKDWPKYKAAFDESPNRPDWELSCGFHGGYIESRSNNSRVAVKHLRAIEGEAKQGKINLYDQDYAPTTKVTYGTLIHRDDAEAYLKRFGLGLDALKQPESIEPSTEETINEQIYRMRVKENKSLHVIAFELKGKAGEAANVGDRFRRFYLKKHGVK
jgi:hypothetical protein